MLGLRCVITSHEVGTVAVVTCNRSGTPHRTRTPPKVGVQREIARIAVRQKPGEALKLSQKAEIHFSPETATAAVSASSGGRFRPVQRAPDRLWLSCSHRRRRYWATLPCPLLYSLWASGAPSPHLCSQTNPRSLTETAPRRWPGTPAASPIHPHANRTPATRSIYYPKSGRTGSSCRDRPPGRAAHNPG